MRGNSARKCAAFYSFELNDGRLLGAATLNDRSGKCFGSEPHGGFNKPREGIVMQDSSDRMTTIQTDWRQEIEWLCGPRLANDTRESWFMRGAKRAGVQWRQIKSLFHREVTDPKFSIGERVKIAAAEARREALEHARQLESLVTRLEHTDEDFYRSQIDAARYHLHQVGGLDWPKE